MKHSVFGALAIAAATALPGAAHAGTIVQQFSTEASGFLGFDAGLGSLVQVDIAIRTLSEATFTMVIPAQATRVNYVTGRYSDYSFTTDANDFVAFIESGDTISGVFQGAELTPTKFFPYDDTVTSTISEDFFKNRFVHDGYINVTAKNLAGLYYNPQRVNQFGEIQDLGDDSVTPINSYYAYTGTVTYTYLSNAGVPEPASWAVMVAGFGAAGGGMRARRKARRLAIA